jgi:hypothetical protein
MLFTIGQATTEVMSTAQSDAETAEAAIGVTTGFGIFGASSLVGGTIGYLLLMKRKVYKCLKCGYILDRA